MFGYIKNFFSAVKAAFKNTLSKVQVFFFGKKEEVKPVIHAECTCGHCGGILAEFGEIRDCELYRQINSAKINSSKKTKATVVIASPARYSGISNQRSSNQTAESSITTTPHSTKVPGPFSASIGIRRTSYVDPDINLDQLMKSATTSVKPTVNKPSTTQKVVTRPASSTTHKTVVAESKIVSDEFRQKIHEQLPPILTVRVPTPVQFIEKTSDKPSVTQAAVPKPVVPTTYKPDLADQAFEAFRESSIGESFNFAFSRITSVTEPLAKKIDSGELDKDVNETLNSINNTFRLWFRNLG